jgi:hypothetical protein
MTFGNRFRREDITSRHSKMKRIGLFLGNHLGKRVQGMQ